MNTEHNNSPNAQDADPDRRLAEAESLWGYFPQLLRYPVRGYALGVVIVLGVLFTVAFHAGLWGIPMLAILAGWLCFYLLEIVGDSVSGHALPPPLGTEVFSEFEFGAIGLLLAYVIGLELIPLYFAAFHHSATGRWLAVVMLFFLPAFIVLLAIEDHAWNALNPFKLVQFIMQIGFAYLLICAVMVIAMIVAIVLGRHLASVFAYMLLLYCIILVCHLLGFIAYHRQEQLELIVAIEKPTEESRRTEALQVAHDDLLKNIDRLVATNNARGAANLIIVPVNSAISPRVFYEKLFDALRIRRYTALALVTGSRLIDILSKEKRFERALDIYEQCLDLGARFEPRDLNLNVSLAETALQARRFPLFERIVANATARHPRTDMVVSLIFLRARYLAEIRKDDSAARAMLEPLLANTDHPWHFRIMALYRAVDSGQQMS